ncbi:hypothetical protein Gotur_027310, partial [Gossypium turneri]
MLAIIQQGNGMEVLPSFDYNTCRPNPKSQNKKKMIDKARTLKGVRFSLRGSSAVSNTLGSAATDSQSTREETPSQTAEEVPATLAGTSIVFSLILSL